MAGSDDPQERHDMFSEENIKLESNLTSPDKENREKGMSLLYAWLTSKREVTEEELLKIWTRLLCCLKHVEKAAAQDLANRMACLMERLNVDLSLLLFRVLLTSIRREWDSIGNNHSDNFHLLLKQFVSHMFLVLKSGGWHLEKVKQFMGALLERSLLAQDGVMANEVNVQIAESFIYELNQYLPISVDVFEALLEPFWMTLAKGGDKTTVERVVENVFLVLLDYGCRLLVSKQEGNVKEMEVEQLGTLAITLPFLIRTKGWLAFTSETNADQLNLIKLKLAEMENLLAQSGSTVQAADLGNAAANSHQTQSRSNSVCLADNGRKAEPMRTFGRRSKMDQKLVGNDSNADQTVLHMESISAPAVFQTWGEPDTINKVDEKQELGKDGSSDEALHTDLCQVNMALSQQQRTDNQGTGSSPLEQQNVGVSKGLQGVLEASEDGISLEDSVISNLTKRFESIAGENSGFESCVPMLPTISTPLAPSPINTDSRKRKSWRCSPINPDSESPTSAKENNLLPNLFEDHSFPSVDNSSAKKAKKVQFSLKDNIVWKPSTPLPPHSVRVPPAATPRGSALKKGVPPGPIFETPSIVPKKKKSTPRRAPSAHVRSPKTQKNSAKASKPARKGRLSPR